MTWIRRHPWLALLVVAGTFVIHLGMARPWENHDSLWPDWLEPPGRTGPRPIQVWLREGPPPRAFFGTEPDAQEQSPFDRPGDFRVWFPRVPSTSGLWSTTAITWRCTPLLHPDVTGAPPPPLTDPAQREEIAAALERATQRWQPDSRAPEGFRAGVALITEPRPIGYVHNTISLALLLATLCLGVGAVRFEFRAWAARRRIRPGLCPRCAYDVSDGVDTCPECGEVQNTPTS